MLLEQQYLSFVAVTKVKRGAVERWEVREVWITGTKILGNNPSSMGAVRRQCCICDEDQKRLINGLDVSRSCSSPPPFTSVLWRDSLALPLARACLRSPSSPESTSLSPRAWLRTPGRACGAPTSPGTSILWFGAEPAGRQCSYSLGLMSHSSLMAFGCHNGHPVLRICDSKSQPP